MFIIIRNNYFERIENIGSIFHIKNNITILSQIECLLFDEEIYCMMNESNFNMCFNRYFSKVFYFQYYNSPSTPFLCYSNTSKKYTVGDIELVDYNKAVFGNL